MAFSFALRARLSSDLPPSDPVSLARLTAPASKPPLLVAPRPARPVPLRNPTFQGVSTHLKPLKSQPFLHFLERFQRLEPAFRRVQGDSPANRLVAGTN